MSVKLQKKICIVDDDEMQRTALSDYIMSKTPHCVTCYGTGEELLQKLSEMPDIIILDYYLNSIDKNAANGIDTLTAIRKRHVPAHVIMLSSQEHYGIALQSLQRGAEQYVIKDEDCFDKIVDMINAID